MNTNDKGKRFEEKVYEYLRKQIELDALPINSEYAKIFRNKGYFSASRNDEIIVDISIEVWMPGAQKYSLILLVECKDYSKPIDVSEIEEFHSKILQISGLNCKGIFVTSNSLQKSAFNYAKSKGLWVIRILPEEQVQHILYQSEIDIFERKFEERKTDKLEKELEKHRKEEILQALTVEKYVSNFENIYFYIEDEFGQTES